MNKPLAYSYILPKRKKNFTTARPIISFANSNMGLLLKALSHTLIQITKTVFPDNFHALDVNQTFRMLHRFLKKKLPNINMHNDDLAGFYTSVPHQRIKDALNFALQQYLIQQPASTKPITFSVKPTSKCKFTRFIRGRSFKRTGVSKLIYFDDIPSLVELTLKHSYFTSQQKSFTQRRGSCIGSPISPALCNLTVALDEFYWTNTYGTFKKQIYCNRYVDNRLILLPHDMETTAPFTELLDLNFYKHPVILEPENNNVYLGFQVNHENHTCKYIIPPDTYQYRSPFSAGSLNTTLSGMRSRLHLLKLRTFPKHHINESAHNFLQMYVQKGFQKRDLYRLAKLVIPTLRMQK